MEGGPTWISPLHVMTKVEVRQAPIDQWVPDSGDLSTLTSVIPINLRIWSKNPTYRWGLTGCFWDMYTTSHSWSCSLTNVNSRMGSTRTTKGAWSGTLMGPWPIKALVLECRDGAWEGAIASVLGSTPQHSRLKYTPLRLVY
jgi:hypothetical protein